MKNAEDNNKQTNKNTDKGASTLRAAFGICMIIVYWGMGYLLFSGSFEHTISNKTISTSLGCIFIVYGVWRGYRLWRNMP